MQSYASFAQYHKLLSFAATPDELEVFVTCEQKLQMRRDAKQDGMHLLSTEDFTRLLNYTVTHELLILARQERDHYKHRLEFERNATSTLIDETAARLQRLVNTKTQRWAHGRSNSF